MKPKISFLGFMFLLGLLWLNSSLEAQVNRQKLFSIGTEETAVYGESEIFLENTGGKASLVTVDNNSNYFFYDKGIRKGPFEKSEDCNFETAEGDESLYTSIYNSEGSISGKELASTNEEGKLFINSGAKKYGPFESILNVWSDKSGKFLMAVTGEGNNISLLTTNGTIIPLEGLPYATSISPSGNKIVITVIREENPALGYMNHDFSKMTTEELLKMSKEIEEKQKNAPPPEAFLYSNDGRRFGPYPKEAVYGGNPFFCHTGGDNWLFLNDTELFVNGSFLAKIPLDYVSSGDLWLSEDGKRFVVIAYDMILFSDGQSFPFPLKTRMLKKDGKTWLTWICLENNTDIVIYTKAL